MYNRAKLGISDLKTEKFKSTAKFGDTQVNTYSTTQLLKKEQLENGDIVESYITSTFADSPTSLDTASAVSPAAPLTDGYRGESQWDPSISVQAYSTIYYNYVYSGSIKHVKLVNVDGGWNISDHSVYVYSSTVTLGESGVTSFKSPGYVQQTTSYYPTSSYSYNAPDSWVAVKADSASDIGMSCNTTLKRSPSGSTWSYWLQNKWQ